MTSHLEQVSKSERNVEVFRRLELCRLSNYMWKAAINYLYHLSYNFDGV